MNPTQALVAIWLNVATENMRRIQEVAQLRTLDRQDGRPRLSRVGYRYNAVDESADHNVLCTFEGDTLVAFTSDYYKESRDNPSPVDTGSAWPSSAMPSAPSTACRSRSARRTVLTAPWLYMVSPNPDS